jgi:prolyl 4-hydroxylase
MWQRNRFATVFFYLNEPESGGETGFPRSGKLDQPRDFLDCTRGIAVKPRRLAVLIFYSMLPNGDFDQTSLHAGCDVKAGVKWSANFWFWNQVQTSFATAEAMAAELSTPDLMREIDVEH